MSATVEPTSESNSKQAQSTDPGANLRSGGLVNVQPPRPADLQPKYAHQVENDTEDPAAHSWYANMIHSLGSCLGGMGAIPCCFCCPNPFKPVPQGEVGLVSKFGRYAPLFSRKQNTDMC